MKAEPETLLELKSVAKAYNGNQVLKGISLEVKAGEFLTFLGPSGCGKTTTLRLIGGFEEPDEGRIFLKGRDVTGVPPNERDVHTVFQHYALFPHYDVFENVAFSLRLKRVPEPEIKDRVHDALDLVRLEGMETRKVHEISGGQQQRVAVARALVGRPSLLLLDEPLGALDLKLRRQMQLELKAIQKKTGITFVYVTHDQEEALTLSDRIAVFKAGRIVQLGPPKAIYDAPRSSFVADFIGSANIINAKIERLTQDSVKLLLEGKIEAEIARPQGVLDKEGENLQVAIRPERIEVCFAQPLADVPGSVCIPADLKQIVYLGSSSQVVTSPFGSRKRMTAVTTAPIDPNFQNGHGKGRTIWLVVRSSDILPLV